MVLAAILQSSRTYRRSLDDRDSLNDLFLVHLRTWAVKVPHDGGHAGLVAHSGSKVHWLLRVILGKAGNVSASTLVES
jgi:hypothetical protein